MLNKRAKYGDDWGVPSAEHPAGECLNRSAPGVEDGSYFEKSWVNDLMALSGALMNSVGYTPNGIEDTATACQVFDALVNNRWTAIGNYSVGTIVTASNGKQYYCNKANGRDSSTIDPTSDSLDNWREYPYKKVSNSNGTALKYYNGDVLMYGSGQAYPENGSVLYVNLPVPLVSGFDIAKNQANAIHIGTDASNTNIIVDSLSFGSTDKISFKTDFAVAILVSWELKGEWA